MKYTAQSMSYLAACTFALHQFDAVLLTGEYMKEDKEMSTQARVYPRCMLIGKLAGIGRGGPIQGRNLATAGFFS